MDSSLRSTIVAICKDMRLQETHSLQNSPWGEVNHIWPLAYNWIIDKIASKAWIQVCA